MANQRNYVSQVYQDALAMGIPEPQARLAAAQSSIETGYGEHAPGNAYFGIKAGGNYDGPTQTLNTKEEVNGQLVPTTAKFRAYDAPSGSLKDWWSTLQDNWPDAASASNFDDAVSGLNTGRYGKYATDSKYPSKLSFVNSNFGPVIPPANVDPAGSQMPGFGELSAYASQPQSPGVSAIVAALSGQGNAAPIPANPIMRPAQQPGNLLQSMVGNVAGLGNWAGQQIGNGRDAIMKAMPTGKMVDAYIASQIFHNPNRGVYNADTNQFEPRQPRMPLAQGAPVMLATANPRQVAAPVMVPRTAVRGQNSPRDFGGQNRDGVYQSLA